MVKKKHTILGISCNFHDAASALLVDGEVVAAIHQERISRLKHDAQFPLEAINTCLEIAEIEMGDVDDVVFYEKPLEKFERISLESLREFPRGRKRFVGAMSTWLGERLWTAAKISKTLGLAEEKIKFCRHHHAHAASSFFSSPFAKAAVLTVDGVGEKTTTAIFQGDGSHLHALEEQHYPHSLGLLYSTFTAYLGFRVNNGEYKVMGLAAYGEPRFVDKVRAIASVSEDGVVSLELKYFDFLHDLDRSYSKEFVRLFGSPRSPKSSWEHMEPQEFQHWADLASSIQSFFTEAMLKLSARAVSLGGSRNLCLAGGCALNVVANRAIAESGLVDTLFVHPAAGDAGGALGAALYQHHHGYKSTRNSEQVRNKVFTPFLGAAASEAEEALVAAMLEPYSLQRSQVEDVVANRLNSGEICGWFWGRGEWGPRALGARSILADPRIPGIQERINRSIKFRESFRPFAPVILEDDFEHFFEAGRGADTHLLPYMCSIVECKERCREIMPGVVHVDGTARVQVVRDQEHPLFALLHAVRRKTGAGILLNTSFNLKGEPIVGSPLDAYTTLVRSNFDFLVMNGALYEPRAQKQRLQGERNAA